MLFLLGSAMQEAGTEPCSPTYPAADSQHDKFEVRVSLHPPSQLCHGEYIMHLGAYSFHIRAEIGILRLFAKISADGRHGFHVVLPWYSRSYSFFGLKTCQPLYSLLRWSVSIGARSLEVILIEILKLNTIVVSLRGDIPTCCEYAFGSRVEWVR